MSWDEARPAFYEPKARLLDMDKDGFLASVLYPNFSRAFIGISRNLVGTWKDSSTIAGDLLLACIRAYNDHLSEFCSADPRRLVGAAILPLDTVENAVQEFRRAARLPGIRGAVMPIEPLGGTQWNGPCFEPLRATAQETGVPLSMHIGAKKGTPPGPGATEAVLTIAKMSTVESLAFVLWAGVFDRYQSMKLMSVERGIGWLGYFRERADNVYKRHRFYNKSLLKNPPGSYTSDGTSSPPSRRSELASSRKTSSASMRSCGPPTTPTRTPPGPSHARSLKSTLKAYPRTRCANWCTSIPPESTV